VTEQSLRHLLGFLFSWFAISSAIFLTLVVLETQYVNPDYVSRVWTITLFGVFPAVWIVMSKLTEAPPLMNIYVSKRDREDQEDETEN